MPNFDLVAFDLDGTVYVEHAKLIRPRVIRAFEAAHNAGVLLAVASGRPLGMLGPSLKDAPWLDWNITVNGACVSNAHTGEIVAARMMPVKQVQAIVACVRTVGGTAGRGGWSLFAPGLAGFDVELSRHKFAGRGAADGNRTNFSFVENALASGQEVEEIPSVDEALEHLSTDVFKIGCMFDTEQQTQDAMRALVKEATTVICMASTLHTVATGNMTPSYRLVNGVVRPVYFYSVDVSEFAVNKLRDRGSLSVRTIVTNVQDFVVNVRKGVL